MNATIPNSSKPTPSNPAAISCPDDPFDPRIQKLNAIPTRMNKTFGNRHGRFGDHDRCQPLDHRYVAFLKQIGLERLAADVGGGCGHVHDFTGGSNREHPPERNILRRWPKRDFPSVRFDDVHDDGRNQHDEERDRTELRRRIVDVPGTDMPNEETKGEKTETQ